LSLGGTLVLFFGRVFGSLSLVEDIVNGLEQQLFTLWLCLHQLEHCKELFPAHCFVAAGGFF
jgi:hypothetical protein